ncbi:MAG: hypothetical protein RBR42_13595, partial [Desulfomicrobium sp.]|nr:hypothetical protein [Desulfomicrobium sp.]
INLVALADLKGDKGDTGNDGVDGQEVSIQKTTTHIQWRLGNGSWVNLIPLADLKGEMGADAPPLNIIEPSVIGVGGIPSGTTFNNITFPEFVSMLLYPELFPGLVSPSRTFTASVSGLKEVGEVIPEITFTSAFNRGQITPQYESESPYRSGLPSEYQFDHVNIVEGAKLTSIVSNLLSASQAISSYVVVIGVQSWRGRVSYSQGVQPKGSKGTNFDSPLVASTTAYITRSITGVYPCFASLHAGGIATLSKLTLAQHASVVVTDMAAEGGGVKQAALFPTLWGVLSKLEQYNELSGQWDTITLASFTQTSEPNFSYGSGFSSYNRYTHNGGAIGRRSLRWTFT